MTNPFSINPCLWLIPPALQQQIRETFLREGWSGEVKFDSYIEDYDW